MLSALCLLTVSCGGNSETSLVFNNYDKNTDAQGPDGTPASLELTLAIPQGEGEVQKNVTNAIKELISQSSIAQELGSPEEENLQAIADNYNERFKNGIAEGDLEALCVYHLQITCPYSNPQCAVLHVSDGIYGNGGPREYVFNVRLSDGRLMPFNEISTMTSSNVKQLAQQYANEEDKEDIRLNLEDCWLYPTSEGCNVKVQTGTHFFKDFVIPMEEVAPYLTSEGKVLFGIAEEKTEGAETQVEPIVSAPESLIQNLLENLKNKDFDTAYNLLTDKEREEKIKSQVGSQRYEQMKNRDRQELARNFSAGIESYEITSRDLDEEGGIGLYWTKFVMSNGKEKKQAIFAQRKNGTWILGFIDGIGENYTLKELRKDITL